jgi:hypothetical protein
MNKPRQYLIITTILLIFLSVFLASKSNNQIAFYLFSVLGVLLLFSLRKISRISSINENRMIFIKNSNIEKSINTIKYVIEESKNDIKIVTGRFTKEIWNDKNKTLQKSIVGAIKRGVKIEAITMNSPIEAPYIMNLNKKKKIHLFLFHGNKQNIAKTKHFIVGDGSNVRIETGHQIDNREKRKAYIRNSYYLGNRAAEKYELLKIKSRRLGG